MPHPHPHPNGGLKTYALFYASFGFPVVPFHTIYREGDCTCTDGKECPKPGKHPRVSDFQQKATTDPDQIEAWWGRDDWLYSNITMLTGLDSGLVVLDFEVGEGLRTKAALERKFEPLPKTPMSRSGGGGLHVWMRHPGGVLVPSGDRILGPSADVKGDNGWITVPPSAHASGGRYRWTDANLEAVELAVVPNWILEQLARARETGETAISETEAGAQHTYRRSRALTGESYTLPATIGSGDRNGELHRYASSLRARGAEGYEIETALEEANNRCNPPLSPRELQGIAKSALKYPAGEKFEPRQRAPAPEPPGGWRERSQPVVTEVAISEPPAWIDRAGPPDEPQRRPNLRIAPAPAPTEPNSEPPAWWGDTPPDGSDEEAGPPSEPPGGGPPDGGGPTPQKQPVTLAGPDGIPMTDIGNAERLYRDHGTDLRYVAVTKRWYSWTGCRWQHDQRNKVRRLAAVTARRMHPLTTVPPCRNEEHQKAWRAHIKTSESARGLNNSLECLSMHREVSRATEDLDVGTADLLNTPSGLLNLRTLVLSPHAREPMVTKIARVKYDANSKCPRWIDFLMQVMGGDKEMVEFLQRVVGYALTGHTTEHCLFFLHGQGRNGKSTFIETIRHMAGDYGRVTDFGTFLDRPNDTMRADLAALRAARMVTAGEPDIGKRFSEGSVKTMTGGDSISCRHLYGDFFEYTPEYKVFLAANYKPTVRGQDEGIWRRFRLIPFDVQIAEDKKDLQLGEKLREEWPGILTWAARGAAEWYRSGLRPPQKVLLATAEYRDEMDAIGQFVRENFWIGIPGKDHGVMASVVYEVYTTWCRMNGEFTVAQRKLSHLLKERGYESIKRGGNRVYANWGRKADNDREN